MKTPPIPPESKYFEVDAEDDSIVFFQVTNKTQHGMVVIRLDLVPEEWRFVIAAVAIEEWEVWYEKQPTPPRGSLLLVEEVETNCDEWRAWRDQK